MPLSKLYTRTQQSIASEVLTILDEAETPYVHIHNNPTAQQLLEIENNKVLLFTSNEFFRQYDPHNPECIAVALFKKRPPHMIIHRNRELDLKKEVLNWLKRDFIGVQQQDPSLKCKRCSKTKSSAKVTICHSCNEIICGKCRDLNSDNVGSYKCPLCGYWFLQGEKYGVKQYTDLIKLPDAALTLMDPIGQFMTLLSYLDGYMEIIPQVDSRLMTEIKLNFCQLPFTEPPRYSLRGRTIAFIEDVLRKLYILTVAQKHAHFDFKIYTIRTTCLIDPDKNKPISEVSLFKLTRTELIQYPIDAMVTPFKDGSIFTLKYVAYMEPQSFALHPEIKALIEQINVEHPKCEKIVSILHPWVDNFSIAPDDSYEDMTEAYLGSLIKDLVTARYDFNIAFRILEYPDDDSLANYVLYHVELTRPELPKRDANGAFIKPSLNFKAEIASVRKLDPKTAREIFNEDIDSLKRTKFIKKFL